MVSTGAEVTAGAEEVWAAAEVSAGAEVAAAELVSAWAEVSAAEVVPAAGRLAQMALVASTVARASAVVHFAKTQEVALAVMAALFAGRHEQAKSPAAQVVSEAVAASIHGIFYGQCFVLCIACGGERIVDVQRRMGYPRRPRQRRRRREPW